MSFFLSVQGQNQVGSSGDNLMDDHFAKKIKNGLQQAAGQ